jgi:rhodanese-related sulfurtransferase
MRLHLFRFFLAAAALLSSLIRRWRRPGKMSPHQLQTLLSQGESPLVLDVRNPDEFVGEWGHITEAVFVPLPELNNKLSEFVSYRARVIVTV